MTFHSGANSLIIDPKVALIIPAPIKIMSFLFCWLPIITFLFYSIVGRSDANLPGQELVRKSRNGQKLHLFCLYTNYITVNGYYLRIQTSSIIRDLDKKVLMECLKNRQKGPPAERLLQSLPSVFYWNKKDYGKLGLSKFKSSSLVVVLAAWHSKKLLQPSPYVAAAEEAAA
nr:hypothetical protein [Planococcus glaciei]